MTSASFAGCTVCTSDYLPLTRVLAASFAEHNPGTPFVALVLDSFDASELRDDDAFTAITPADTGIDPDEFAWMTTIYTPFELSCAMKPWVIGYTRERFAAALFFDSDIRIYGPLQELADLADRHGLVLTPHETAPPAPSSGQFANEGHFVFGQFNGGFVAVGSEDHGFITWWKGVLARECVQDARNHRYVDQRWLDMVVNYFPVHICRHPGANLAFWNLGHRAPSYGADGTLVVGDQPLLFFHYSGFDPLSPVYLSNHPDPPQRLRLTSDPTIERMALQYAEQLVAAGYGEAGQASPPFAHTPDGTLLSPRTRWVVRRALIHAENAGQRVPTNPMDPHYAGDLTEWLRAPSLPGGVTRYLEQMWMGTAAISRAFPSLESPCEGERYLAWARGEGVARGVIDAGLCAPVPQWELVTDASRCVLVMVDDVLANPELLSRHVASFTPTEGTAFLLWAPLAEPEDVSKALEPIIEASPDAIDGPEIIASTDPYPTSFLRERMVAVLSDMPPRDGLQSLPHAEDGDGLRALLTRRKVAVST